MMVDEEKDFKRPEGLYVSFSQPDDGMNTPVIVERVNGNCTVTKFIMARDEAKNLIAQLQNLFGGK